MKYTSFLYNLFTPWSWLSFHAMAAVGAAGVAASVWGSSQQAGLAEEAMDDQAKAIRKQTKMAQEQWNMYKGQIFPLEQEAREMGVDAQRLALERYGIDSEIYKQFYAPLSEQFAEQAMEGVEPQYERVAREARAGVHQAFDVEEGMRRRDLQRRGVMRPGSGQEAGAMGDTSLARAATSALAVNQAREAERDRAEDIGFNRMAVALGRQPASGGVPVGFQGSAISPATSVAAGRTAVAGYGQQAGTYAQGAAGTLASGLELTQRGMDLASQYGGGGFSWGGGGAPAPAAPATPTGSQQFQMGTGNLNTILGPQTDTAYYQGGKVMSPRPGYADGGPVDGYAGGGPIQAPALMRGGPPANPGGEVSGPPGRDQVPAYIESPTGQKYPAALTDDEYVIPQDVVRAVGTNAIEEFIENARNPRGRTQ